MPDKVRIDWNPVSHLIETKNYKSARLIRSSFKQRLKDIYTAFFGSLFETRARVIKLGYFDYFLIFPRLFFNLARSFYRNLKKDAIRNDDATTSDSKMGSYTRAYHCIREGMFFLGIALAVIASIRIIPKIILTVSVGAIALALNLVKAVITLATTLAAAVLFALPIHLITWSTRRDLFNRVKSLTFKSEHQLYSDDEEETRRYSVSATPVFNTIRFEHSRSMSRKESAKVQTLGDFLGNKDEDALNNGYSMIAHRRSGSHILFELVKKFDRGGPPIGVVELQSEPQDSGKNPPMDKDGVEALLRLNLFNVTKLIERPPYDGEMCRALTEKYEIDLKYKPEEPSHIKSPSAGVYNTP
jgi:hypothetical protein